MGQLPEGLRQPANEYIARREQRQDDLRARLTKMHVERNLALKGEFADDDTWDLYYPEFSFAVWRLVDGLEWKHLPGATDLLGVDEALLDDLLTISYVSQVVEELVKSNEKAKNG